MSDNPYEPPLLKEDAKQPAAQTMAWYGRYPLAFLVALLAMFVLIELNVAILIDFREASLKWSDINVIAYVQMVVAFLALMVVSVSILVGSRFKRVGYIGFFVFVGALLVPPLLLPFRLLWR